MNIPNHVPLQEPFQINYRIHNRSNIVHEYKVNLEQINVTVAVAGNTVVRISISHSIELNSNVYVSDIITRSTT